MIIKVLFCINYIKELIDDLQRMGKHVSSRGGYNNCLGKHKAVETEDTLELRI